MANPAGLPPTVSPGRPAAVPAPRRPAGVAVLALAALLLAGCARDTEPALRAQLEQWFHLGTTSYFRSRMRCTAAMIHVTSGRPRPGLEIRTDPGSAKRALRADGIAAIRIDGVAPTEMTDLMLLTGDGHFGRQALAAGALAGPCLDGGRIGASLHEALSRPGATMVYDAGNEGLMILDPARSRLFYIAGDVW